MARPPLELVTIDRYGYKPEHGLHLDDSDPDKPKLTTCVIIPTALPSNNIIRNKSLRDTHYHPVFIDNVHEICNAKKPARQYVPRIIGENIHFDFKKHCEYTVLAGTVEYQKNDQGILLPSSISMGISEGMCIEKFIFQGELRSKRKKTRRRKKLILKDPFYDFDGIEDFDEPDHFSEPVEKILSLQHQLIAQEQQTKRRFLHVGKKWSPGYYDAGNLIISEHVNLAAAHYFDQIGGNVIERQYNVGGSYKFSRMKTQGTPQKGQSLFNHTIGISAAKQMELFISPSQRSSYFKWTKPGEMDCAVNLQLINECRQGGAKRVSNTRAKKIAGILNNNKIS